MTLQTAAVGYWLLAVGFHHVNLLLFSNSQQSPLFIACLE